MQSEIKIGTRESELAVWQATMVKDLLQNFGYSSTLVYIKSEGDIDLKTPLYEMGVQGIFTRSLDIALLNGKIDIAVHSMKDVPTLLPTGIAQAAVIKRGNYKDLFVINSSNNVWNKKPTENWEREETASSTDHFLTSLNNDSFSTDELFTYVPNIATSSIRRKAQWLHRYPHSHIENIRGNVNTRLKKVDDSNWHGAIFAAAGLERINKRPQNSVELDWMLPAPAQGAVMVVAKTEDNIILEACNNLNDEATATCTNIERDFLRELMGGCSTPISALAQIHNNEIHFEGNILSLDGKEKATVKKSFSGDKSNYAGAILAQELLKNGGAAIAELVRNGK